MGNWDWLKQVPANIPRKVYKAGEFKLTKMKEQEQEVVRIGDGLTGQMFNPYKTEAIKAIAPPLGSGLTLPPSIEEVVAEYEKCKDFIYWYRNYYQVKPRPNYFNGLIPRGTETIQY